jgi:hypothetical protein
MSSPAPSAGRHPGHDGAFQLLTIGSPNIGSREVAYAGAQIGGRLIEAGDEVATLAIWFGQIGDLALSKDDSRKLIEQVMRTYE